MKLLCIDDDPDDFLLFQDAVRACDIACSCLGATNGEDALRLLESFIPDLIFLDRNMPRMNGYDTLLNIRANSSLDSIPVYILSTHIAPGDCRHLMKIGAAGCLMKPDSFDKLCDMLHDVIRQHLVKD